MSGPSAILSSLFDFPHTHQIAPIRGQDKVLTVFIEAFWDFDDLKEHKPKVTAHPQQERFAIAHAPNFSEFVDSNSIKSLPRCIGLVTVWYWLAPPRRLCHAHVQPDVS